MREDIKKEYDAALAKAIIANGTLCSTGSWAYGYIADDWAALSECRKTCTITYAKIDEGSWEDFNSFARGTPRKVIDMTGVNCSCGALRNRTIRWDVSPSEAIEKVFEIAFTKAFGERGEPNA